MSLIVNGSSAASYAPIPEGTYLAVCNMLVDLGVQKNETYGNSSRKVLVGWEIPEETIDIDGQPHSRTIRKKYTASLNEKASLRKDLAAWRGRDFTAQDLGAFDLHNIVGTSCMINVIHSEGQNGRTYANISAIMALPRGMAKGKLSEPALVFDLDTATLDDVDELPGWLGDMIKKSSTYQDMLAAEEDAPPEAHEAPDFEDLPDDEGELPF